MRTAALCLALVALGCGNDPAEEGPALAFGPASTTLYEPPLGGGIVGDWFACADPACAVLDNRGLRFAADGAFALLRAAAAHYEPGGAYCATAVARYLWNGREVTLFAAADGADVGTLVFLVDRDRAQVVSEDLAWLKRIRPVEASGCEPLPSD